MSLPAAWVRSGLGPLARCAPCAAHGPVPAHALAPHGAAGARARCSRSEPPGCLSLPVRLPVSCSLTTPARLPAWRPPLPACRHHACGWLPLDPGRYKLRAEHHGGQGGGRQGLLRRGWAVLLLPSRGTGCMGWQGLHQPADASASPPYPQYIIPPSVSISPAGLEMLSHLLCADPDRRWSTEQVGGMAHAAAAMPFCPAPHPAPDASSLPAACLLPLPADPAASLVSCRHNGFVGMVGGLGASGQGALPVAIRAATATACPAQRPPLAAGTLCVCACPPACLPCPPARLPTLPCPPACPPAAGSRRTCPRVRAP